MKRCVRCKKLRDLLTTAERCPTLPVDHCAICALEWVLDEYNRLENERWDKEAREGKRALIVNITAQ